MPNSYINAHDYARAVTGQSITSLLGNLMRVGVAGIAQGGTSLAVIPNTTVALNVYDPITIFDGASTEVVTVTATTAPGASSIPITATQFAHAAGISCCSDGVQGSLAESIIEGCAEVEQICFQPLLQATYTGETLPLVSTRAWVDSSMALGIRPRQFPVQSVSAVTLVFVPVTSTLNLDLTNLTIDAIGRIVEVSVVKSVNVGGGFQLTQYLDQSTEGFVKITYTAGYAYAQVPGVIKRAATLLTSDILSDRYNPTGVASNQEGKRRIDAFLRGDVSGESALVKRARHWLKPYTQDAL